MWEYHISTGTLLHDGDFMGTGYSGKGRPGGGFRNNPAAIREVARGPIPPGDYTIGDAHSSPLLGPIVMNLEPKEGTNTFGRSLFRIHGDNARNDASHGCIILGPSLRRIISLSGDNSLKVIE